MEKYLLVTTDGYEIKNTQYDKLDDAQIAMMDAYKSYEPDEWLDYYRDISYCGCMDAILYDNGENVYVWQIIPVVFKEDSNE